MTSFDWLIRVYYEDTDAGGVVFYANYLKFFERARTEMLRAQGVEQDSLIEKDNTIFMVRSTQIDYLRPAKFNQQLLVHSEIVQIKKASLIFEQQVIYDERILCKGVILIACVDSECLRPKAIPAHLVAKFQD